MLRDWQLRKVDVGAVQAVLVERRLGGWPFARVDRNAQLLLGAADQFQRGRGRVFLERDRGARDAGSEQVPEMAKAVGLRVGVE
jgi:hypothetical protein